MTLISTTKVLRITKPYQGMSFVFRNDGHFSMKPRANASGRGWVICRGWSCLLEDLDGASGERALWRASHVMADETGSRIKLIE